MSHPESRTAVEAPAPSRVGRAALAVAAVVVGVAGGLGRPETAAWVGLVGLVVAAWGRQWGRDRAGVEGLVRGRTRELVESEERLRGALDAAAIGMALVSLDGRWLRVNRSLCQLVGYGEEELLALTFQELTDPADLAADLGQVGRLLAGEIAEYHMEKRYVHKSGRPVWALLSVSLVRDAGGAPAYFVSQIQDIGDRRRAERELYAAKTAAEDASRAKGEFLANMSHEIRTPLNGILGLTESVLGGELTADQRESLGMVRSSADALMAVINDILDFSKIEAGKLDLDPTPFAPADAVADALKLLALRARAKGLRLVADVRPGVPAVAVGDAGRLRQVLTNLVGNAVKFTAQGEVAVRVELVADGASGPRLRFRVSDTGVGIPRAKQATIFDAFTQADGSTTRRYGGTGLGLTISSRLVTLMGGRIWVESEPGRGSCFTFEVALGRAGSAALQAPASGRAPASVVAAPAPPSAERAERPAPPRPARHWGATASRPLRILLAEDNAVNQRVAVRLLEALGHAVAVAGHGGEALAALDRAAFDLVLMDVQMPEVDGFEATAEIRRREEGTGRRTPVVAMTAHAMKGDRERCLAAGMDDYLSKPVARAEMVRVLAWADARKARPAAGPPPLDRAAAVERLEGDEGLWAEVAALFRADAPRLLAELREAIGAADPAAVQRAAHGLKGAAGYVGAGPTADAAHRLERLGAAGDLAAAAGALADLDREVSRLLADLDAGPGAPAAAYHGVSPRLAAPPETSDRWKS